MESDLQQHHHHLLDYHQPQRHHQKQMNSGLSRYQSAPSSYFSNILESVLDKDFCREFLNRPSSPETEKIIAGFLSNTGDAGDGGGRGNTGNNISEQNLCGMTQQDPHIKEAVVKIEQQTLITPPISNQQNFFQQNLPNQQSGSSTDYRIPNPTTQMKMGGANNSNLIRQSSSPAGLFANIDIENIVGYGAMRGMGDYGSSNRNIRAAAAATFPSANRPPPSGRMSPIAEMGNKNMAAIVDGSESAGFGENCHNNYSSGFPLTSWDESMMISDNMSAVKRVREDDRSLSGLDLDGAETQNTYSGNRPPLLSHHLSLPKSSPDMSAIEKFLQYQDSVPCKIRAKRGCATHPRSIAERVRRTKISERMRKLQDLVPNMDKQTNTADMLDLAVDYIKDLQNQVKTLSDSRAKCSCPNKQQQ